MDSICTELIGALHRAGRSLEDSTKNLRVAFIGSRVAGAPSDLLTRILRSASVYKHGMLPLETNLVERVRKFCDYYTVFDYSDFKATLDDIIEEAKDNKSSAKIAKDLHKEMLEELNEFRTQLERDSMPHGNLIEGRRAPLWLQLLKPHRKDYLLSGILSTVSSLTAGALFRNFKNGNNSSALSSTPAVNVTVQTTLSNSSRSLLQDAWRKGNIKGAAVVVAVWGISWVACAFVSNRIRSASDGRNQGDSDTVRSADFNKEKQTLEALVEGLESFAVAMVSVSQFFAAMEKDLTQASSADVLLQQHFESTRKMAPQMQRAAEIFRRHSVSAETDVMSVEETNVTQDSRVTSFLRLKK